jgi:mycofactocin precursor peptide peptidase
VEAPDFGATDLGPMVWTDVGSPILVVPVGSCEQHGPHLPLHTDTVVATALAHELAVERGDCVVAPPLTVTASGEHHGFAGTLSIGNAAMAELVTELVRSAGWAQGVVFVNGHGGNAAAMARAADTLARESRHLLVWWPNLPGGDPHAGHVETSLMLALAPDEVRRDRAIAGPVPAMSELVRVGVQPLSASGVLGDPTNASVEEGRRLFDELAAQLAAAVASWARA